MTRLPGDTVMESEAFGGIGASIGASLDASLVEGFVPGESFALASFAVPGSDAEGPDPDDPEHAATDQKMRPPRAARRCPSQSCLKLNFIKFIEPHTCLFDDPSSPRPTAVERAR
jgi:hypothetical protein